MFKASNRGPVVSVVVALLMLATAAPAGAQAEERYITEGRGDGFAVTIPQAPELVGARSTATVNNAPHAEASGVGLFILDATKSQAAVDGSGTQRDPASGQNCATPELPAPLNVADAACSFSLAEITGGLPHGHAEASGLTLQLTGGDLATLLADFLIGQVEEAGLQAALDTAENQVLEPVLAALTTACNELLATLGLEATATDLIQAVENNNPLPIDLAALGVDNPCLELVELVANPPAIGSPTEILTTLRQTIHTALADTTLLRLLLAGTTADSAAAAAAVTGTGQAIGLDIALPSLNLIGNVVAALTGLVNDFLTAVDQQVASVDLQQLGLPAVGDLVNTVLAGIPISDVLADTDPLLRITGAKSDATATFDRDTGEVTAQGNQAPLIIDPADSLAALLGIPDPITLPQGDTVTIAEGTPLESTLAVGSVTVRDDTRDGLPGKVVEAAGVKIDLIKGLADGGVSVAAAHALAAAYGQAGERALPAPVQLPVTGGGLSLAAIAALGLALFLRRRR
ncbi:MAG: hypothetical protein M3N57_02735 [Actinomycetota bacterium]|nr:hypothetical protein [Actinomycetota bacterium]